MIKIIGLCCLVFLLVLVLFNFFDSFSAVDKHKLVKEFLEEVERESLKKPK